MILDSLDNLDSGPRPHNRRGDFWPTHKARARLRRRNDRRNARRRAREHRNAR